MADCPPPPLTLRLFGSFEAYRGEVPLPRLRRRKDQWLLALLALKPGAEVARTFECQPGFGRRREIGRPSNDPRQVLRDRVEHLAG